MSNIIFNQHNMHIKCICKFILDNLEKLIKKYMEPKIYKLFRKLLNL